MMRDVSMSNIEEFPRLMYSLLYSDGSLSFETGGSTADDVETELSSTADVESELFPNSDGSVGSKSLFSNEDDDIIHDILGDLHELEKFYQIMEGLTQFESKNKRNLTTEEVDKCFDSSTILSHDVTDFSMEQDGETSSLDESETSTTFLTRSTTTSLTSKLEGSARFCAFPRTCMVKAKAKGAIARSFTVVSAVLRTICGPGPCTQVVMNSVGSETSTNHHLQNMPSTAAGHHFCPPPHTVAF